MLSRQDQVYKGDEVKVCVTHDHLLKLLIIHAYRPTQCFR
jgi:hypothetical protein